MTPVVDEPRLSYIIKVECPPYPGRDGHTEEGPHLVCLGGTVNQKWVLIADSTKSTYRLLLLFFFFLPTLGPIHLFEKKKDDAQTKKFGSCYARFWPCINKTQN
jgi:hypothetical protein